jgi:type I restriction enzyme S subunit
MIGQTSFDTSNRVDFRIGRRAQVPETERRLFGLKEGDILLVRVFATPEGVGRPVFVESPPEPSVFESNMMRLRVHTGRIDPYYLWLWMGLPQSRRHFTCRANASTQASINRSVVDCLPCSIPSPPEQARIMRVVREHDGQLNAAEDLLSKLSHLRCGLRDELLTGCTRVTPELLGLPPEDGDV